MCSRTALFAAITALAVTALALAADPFPADVDFVRKAEQAGDQAVADAQAALANSNDPAVRRVAKLMQQDGTEGNRRLAALAVEKGWPSPALERPDAMGQYSNHQFVVRAVRAEQNVIAFYAEEADHGADNRLQEFARAALPTLRRRLDTLKLLRTS